MKTLIALAIATSVAHAEVKLEAAHGEVAGHIVHNMYSPARLGFDLEGTTVDFEQHTEGGGAEVMTKPKNVVTATSGSATWFAFDLDWYDCFDASACKGKKPWTTIHVTLLYDGKAKRVFHYAKPMTAAEYAAAQKEGRKLSPLARKIDKGAEDAAKLFESTIGDAAKLAATVSARKDVVLYGSELKERFVGGDAVKKQLAKWGLAMKVRDGVQAGVAGTTVAWVAANVDTVPAKSPKAKPSPYRVLAIYEKTGTTWQLVQLSYSFYVNPYEGGP